MPFVGLSSTHLFGFYSLHILILCLCLNKWTNEYRYLLCQRRPTLMGICLFWQPAIVVDYVWNCYRFGYLVNKLSLPSLSRFAEISRNEVKVEFFGPPGDAVNATTKRRIVDDRTRRRNPQQISVVVVRFTSIKRAIYEYWRGVVNTSPIPRRPSCFGWAKEHVFDHVDSVKSTLEQLVWNNWDT